MIKCCLTKKDNVEIFPRLRAYSILYCQIMHEADLDDLVGDLVSTGFMETGSRSCASRLHIQTPLWVTQPRGGGTGFGLPLSLLRISPLHFPFALPLRTSPSHFPFALPLRTSPSHFPFALPLVGRPLNLVLECYTSPVRSLPRSPPTCTAFSSLTNQNWETCKAFAVRTDHEDPPGFLSPLAIGPCIE